MGPKGSDCGIVNVNIPTSGAGNDDDDDDDDDDDGVGTFLTPPGECLDPGDLVEKTWQTVLKGKM